MLEEKLLTDKGDADKSRGSLILVNDVSGGGQGGGRQ